MKTYFLEWYDKEMEEMTTIKINDKQASLMEFLLEKLPLREILYQADVTVSITENENQVIDLT